MVFSVYNLGILDSELHWHLHFKSIPGDLSGDAHFDDIPVLCPLIGFHTCNLIIKPASKTFVRCLINF